MVLPDRYVSPELLRINPKCHWPENLEAPRVSSLGAGMSGSIKEYKNIPESMYAFVREHH